MTKEQYNLAVTAIQNKLHASILSLLTDPAAAQDVLQETNLLQRVESDDEVRELLAGLRHLRPPYKHEA